MGCEGGRRRGERGGGGERRGDLQGSDTQGKTHMLKHLPMGSIITKMVTQSKHLHRACKGWTINLKSWTFPKLGREFGIAFVNAGQDARQS